MRKFKVIALSVGAINNTICHSGEEVDENKFEPGRADELVKQGFLKEIAEEKKPVKKNTKKSDG